ncbi:MAG: VWA domain-containing protein, partial [Pseudomonadota bacterium]
DRSSSLKTTDPDNYRTAAATSFIESLSAKSNTQIGAVGFDRKSDLLQGLTADRQAVVKAIQGMRQSGGTNIAEGIDTAVTELQNNARPGASKLVLLFTDGKSNQNKTRDAARRALAQGITVHTMLLGSSDAGSSILNEIAQGTGGTYIQVTDPTNLADAFLNLKTTGVENVTISVNGSAPQPARLTGGSFSGEVPLQLGQNQIVAVAYSLDDQVQQTELTVNLRDASCAAVDVSALYQGLPATSLNERAVQIVLDASRSMWGQLDGIAKMTIAKDTLQSAAQWLPSDLDLAFRAYGNTSASEASNCTDSNLLMPFGTNDRGVFSASVGSLSPKGQTPIAYALQAAGEDFAGLQSERTVVLVTDGIESCGGDPVAAASALAEQGLTVHVIGFGMDNAADEDSASLQAIAHAGGGQYFTAASAMELKQALEATTGTQYRISQGGDTVVQSVLGSDERFYLPQGEYRLQLDSMPPQSVPFELAPRDQLNLQLSKTDGVFSHQELRQQLPAASCEQAVAWQQGDKEADLPDEDQGVSELFDQASVEPPSGQAQTEDMLLP